MDKAPHHRPAETRGQVIDIDRFRTRRIDCGPVALPMVEFGSGWYHEAAMAEAGKAEPKAPLLTLVQ